MTYLEQNENDLKILVFEYNISKLIEWFNSTSTIPFNYDSNDFSKLKCIKLHFFTCSQNTELLTIFNNFKAMPLGPVEADILDAINEDKLSYYKIKLNLTLKSNIQLGPTSPQKIRAIYPQHASYFDQVDQGVNKLVAQNSNLVLRGANDLVEISHHWKSWKDAFSLAKKARKRSYEIKKDAVINEPMKYYGN